MVTIQEEWHKKEQDVKLIFPDKKVNSLQDESKTFALDFVCHFFKSFLKNKRIDLGVDMFPILHDITAKIAKMFYDTNREDFKDNAMGVLQLINGSQKYARLLENVQHPANQNIYIESKQLGDPAQASQEEVGTGKSSLFQVKLSKLANSNDMMEKKEREFEDLVLWVTNIDQRIKFIMSMNARLHHDSSFNQMSFANVSFSPIVSSLMTLLDQVSLDSSFMNKDLHITCLTLLRKIIEVENKELVTPAADWDIEDFSKYHKIIESKQNNMVGIGCIEFLCKHLQDIDDDDILEQTILVCITLLLGGNVQSQNAFYKYFITQDYQSNVILLKLKRLLMEQFDLTKKFIGEKNAKLAMVYKLNQRMQFRQEKLLKKQ
mmetsp:Transcript_6821/g.10994  ORF Transcript_6821/g.10994 Transcript_6821/m.10994 type:complete len:376 (+) Transcript_6821:5204-6331(+)